jgi:integrase
MRPKNEIPSYLRHKASGQARVIINGRTYYLGPYGSPQSKAEFTRLITEWQGSRGPIAPAAPRASVAQATLFVSELIVAFLRYAETYYVKGGRQTSEVSVVQMAMRPVNELYGHTYAKDFGPVALEACRQKLVDRGLARHTINKVVRIIRLMFRWGAARQWIPAGVPQALSCLDGLHKGRSAAKESTKVRPVRDEFVEMSLPYMPRAAAAMVRLQSLTGMRPGEVCIMRGCDLNMAVTPWEYVPQTHKTDYREDDRGRTIYLGPEARAIVREWLKPDLTQYLFNPAETMAEFFTERHENRATPSCPSQLTYHAKEKKSRGRRRDRDHYDVPSYRRAIQRACQKAGVPAFNPNQIRHSTGTKLRREFPNGLEVAGAVLGHGELQTTQIYAEKDAELARRAMEKIG